jgi:transketolase
VRDISALAAMPGLTLIEPSCEAEVGLALRYCVAEAKQSCYLRLVSIPCEVPYRLPAGYRLQRGRGVTLRPGKSVLAIGYGPVLLPQAWHAAGLLAERHGIELEVVNLPWLNEVDAEWLRAAVSGRTHLFTLDNHYVDGGQGQMLLARLGELGLSQPPRCTRIGVRSIPACGQNAEVLRAHGLDAAAIAAAIASAMGR